jgi:hypothetical protein
VLISHYENNLADDGGHNGNGGGSGENNWIQFEALAVELANLFSKKENKTSSSSTVHYSSSLVLNLLDDDYRRTEMRE